MNERLFRDAMGTFATGITAITFYDEKEVVGMTVNAFMSLSLDPMLVAISIDKKATLYDYFQDGTRFGLSILKSSQKDYSLYFARMLDKEIDINYSDLAEAPVIDHALTNLSCQIDSHVDAGDHTIIIAKINDIVVNKGEPLIYFASDYRYLEN